MFVLVNALGLILCKAYLNVVLLLLCIRKMNSIAIQNISQIRNLSFTASSISLIGGVLSDT